MNVFLLAFAFVVTMSLASGDRPFRLIPVRITDTRNVIQNNAKGTDDNSHDPKPSGRFSVEALTAIKAGLIGAGVGGFIGGQVANSNLTFPSIGGGGSSTGTPTCIITRRRRSLGLEDYDDDDNQNYKFTFIADSNAESRQTLSPTPSTPSVSPPGTGTGTGAAINCIIVSKGRSVGDRIMSKRTKFLSRRHIASGTNRFRGRQAKPRL